MPLKKYITRKIIFLFSLFFANVAIAQNTVGAILNTQDALNGYTLFTPNSTTIPNATYLVNNCGEVVNQWNSNFKGQGADLLMPDGSLFRACNDNRSTLQYPGNTGRIEKYDWEGNLIWGFTYSDTDYSFHHDYFPLDNGNILMIVAERRTNAQAIQAGRNPDLVSDDLYNEKIIEIEPVGNDGANIVWEWSLWDHLIQDFDTTKDNYGVISDDIGRIDINYLGLFASQADWIHFNSIDYDVSLDQILISSRHLSEIYVIDHSISTEEATTNLGDVKYRWGNPQAYNQGSSDDQVFFGQHSVHWISEGLPNEGKIMIFNNGFTRGFTTIEFLEPQLDPDNNYLINDDTYLPLNSEIRYQAPNPTDFYAPFLSSAYQLENGNILIDNGPVGELFEVNNSNTIVWNYVSPVLLNGTILSQGDNAGGVNSRFFRGRKYPQDYDAFEGRDLTPSDPIELNPILSNCELLSTNTSALNTFSVFPNPASNSLNIRDFNFEILDYTIFTVQGKKVTQGQLIDTHPIDISFLTKGLYFIKLSNNNDDNIVVKFIKS